MFSACVRCFWQGNNKENTLSDEEMALYQREFARHNVEVKEFVLLLRKGRWANYNKGDIMVQGGQPLNKVLLLHSGDAEAITPKGIVANKYSTANDEGAHDSAGEAMNRGALIGSTRLVEYINDPEKYKFDKPYKNTVKASGPARGVEWDFKELTIQLGESEDKQMERAFVQISSMEMMKQQHQLRTKLRSTKSTEDIGLAEYEIIIKAVCVDGTINQTEREYCAAHRQKHQISDESHTEALKKVGWTPKEFDKGKKRR